MTTPRTSRNLLLAAAAVLLAGCQTFAGPGAGNWSAVRAAKAPVAQPVAYVHPVRFAKNDGVLNAEQRAALDLFVARAKPASHDRLEVSGHDGMVNAARLAVVRDQLAAHRLSVTQIEARDEQPADVVRVVLHTHVVTLPGCPDWTAHPGITWDNTTSSNFGCANARNLGLMVAEPVDLNGERRMGAADGTVQAAAVERYRNGETKALLGGGSTDSTSGATTEGQGGGGN